MGVFEHSGAEDDPPRSVPSEYVRREGVAKGVEWEYSSAKSTSEKGGGVNAVCLSKVQNETFGNQERKRILGGGISLGTAAAAAAAEEDDSALQRGT